MPLPCLVYAAFLCETIRAEQAHHHAVTFLTAGKQEVEILGACRLEKDQMVAWGPSGATDPKLESFINECLSTPGVKTLKPSEPGLVRRFLVMRKLRTVPDSTLINVNVPGQVNWHLLRSTATREAETEKTEEFTLHEIGRDSVDEDIKLGVIVDTGYERSPLTECKVGAFFELGSAHVKVSSIKPVAKGDGITQPSWKVMFEVDQTDEGEVRIGMCDSFGAPFYITYSDNKYKWCRMGDGDPKLSKGRKSRVPLLTGGGSGAFASARFAADSKGQHEATLYLDPADVSFIAVRTVRKNSTLGPVALNPIPKIKP
ncbi:MAG: hypothetical protein JNM34_10165 [Chthonomonadaceae bacterium]|nr:hypothetical protein [Chthonomonadaceae bacterium]